MNFTFIIVCAFAIVVAYAFGWAVGHSVGKSDGYAEHEDWCRRGGRCAR